ncbi:MAG TPA: isoprenylcysteine carboxylmethyltransferase family protein [Vicinamibacterales bacterium]|nr:isoprenylcysteine carboxylmethyltransferase family protein [Vicinamibacterales bacterium]
MKLNIVTLVLLAVAAVVFGRQAARQPWTLWQITGLAIALPSLLLLVLARIQLGRAFSIRAKASTLVTSGLYSRIRHPIYVFGGLLIAGVIIFTGHLILLLILVALIPVQIVRARKESQVLEQKFGAEYAEYKRRTWL